MPPTPFSISGFLRAIQARYESSGAAILYHPWSLCTVHCLPVALPPILESAHIPKHSKPSKSMDYKRFKCSKSRSQVKVKPERSWVVHRPHLPSLPAFLNESITLVEPHKCLTKVSQPRDISVLVEEIGPGKAQLLFPSSRHSITHYSSYRACL